MKRILLAGLLLVAMLVSSGCYALMHPVMVYDERITIREGQSVAVISSSFNYHIGEIFFTTQNSYLQYRAIVLIDGGRNGYGKRVAVPAGARAYGVELEGGEHSYQAIIQVLQPSNDGPLYWENVSATHGQFSVGPQEYYHQSRVPGHWWKLEIVY